MKPRNLDSPAVDHEEAPRQELLPPLRWLLQPNDHRFAHPAEIELARLLTFYGLRWAYEPTTFAVRWGRDGRPVEFVTPDFYLPEHDLYLELTTMRQRLVTRKNRKVPAPARNLPKRASPLALSAGFQAITGCLRTVRCRAGGPHRRRTLCRARRRDADRAARASIDRGLGRQGGK